MSLSSQVCHLAGECVAVHALHLAALNEEVLASMVSDVSAACKNQVLDMPDHPVSPSAL